MFGYAPLSVYCGNLFSASAMPSYGGRIPRADRRRRLPGRRPARGDGQVHMSRRHSHGRCQEGERAWPQVADEWRKAEAKGVRLMERVQMVACVGWHRDTEVPVEVEIIGGIAGKVRCFECEGVPAEEYASWFPPGAVTGCVDCKGTPMSMSRSLRDRHRWHAADVSRHNRGRVGCRNKSEDEAAQCGSHRARSSDRQGDSDQASLEHLMGPPAEAHATHRICCPWHGAIRCNFIN
jgi:hypothetical protein